MIIPAGVRELEQAFHAHIKESQNIPSSCSSYLLLFYAAECGVKSIWLRRRRLMKTDDIPEPDCSKEKIQEIEQENAELQDIFTKLKRLREQNRKSPFTQEEVKLSLDEIDVLSRNGVIIRDGDKYHMCEIFRLGLNFSQNAGRSKVLSLARLAGLG